MTETAQKSRNLLEFILLLIITAMAAVFSGMSLIRTQDLYPVWLLVYILVGLIIFQKLRAGNIYHPILLYGSGYIFLLASGTLVYEYFKGREMFTFAMNLTWVGFIASILGIMIGERIGWKKPRHFNASVNNEFPIYLLAGFALMMTLVLFAKYGNAPIFAANPNEAKVNFLAGNGIYGLFFKGMPIIAMALLYVCFYKQKSLMPAHGYTAIMMVLYLLAGYRSSTMIALGQYIMLYLFLHKFNPNYVKVILVGLLAISFMTVWGAVRRGEFNAEASLKEFDRVLNSRPVMMEVITRNFKESDFYNGSLYTNDLKRFLPGVQVNANVDLKYMLWSNPEDMPELAGITPSIAGEAYMNYGQKGVFWVLLILGIIMGISYKWFVYKPSFMVCGFYLSFILGMASAVQSGFGLKMVHFTQFWFWVVLLGILVDYKILFGKKVLFSSPSS